MKYLEKKKRKTGMENDRQKYIHSERQKQRKQIVKKIAVQKLKHSSLKNIKYFDYV